MDVDSVSGSERDDEVWEDVDEIRRSYNCGLSGTHCQGREDEGKARAKARRAGRKTAASSAATKEELQECPRVEDTKGQWTCGRIGHPSSSMSMESGADEEDADCRNVLES